MLTDHELDEMEKTFRPEAKFNCMGGMGMKLVAEIRRLRKDIRDAKVSGIKLAAEVAGDYDKMSYHGHLVSECILGKLNVLKGKPKKNPAAAKINEALDRLEHKVEGLSGTASFMAQAAKRTLAQKKSAGSPIP
jgi:hypothetical protein